MASVRVGPARDRPRVSRFRIECASNELRGPALSPPSSTTKKGKNVHSSSYKAKRRQELSSALLTPRNQPKLFLLFLEGDVIALRKPSYFNQRRTRKEERIKSREEDDRTKGKTKPVYIMLITLSSNVLKSCDCIVQAEPI